MYPKTQSSQSNSAIYLQQEVRGVVDEHHQGPHSYIIRTVRECDEENGGDVMNDLLFEVLHNQEIKHISTIYQLQDPYRFMLKESNLLCALCPQTRRAEARGRRTTP